MPQCEIHHKEMRPGKKGGWFCSTKTGTDGDGRAIWCDYRIKGEPRSTNGTNQVNSPDLLAAIRELTEAVRELTKTCALRSDL